MSLFQSLGAVLDPFLYKVCAPFFVLCGLILIHEFGHFIVAKWCGVGVVRFSVGFGPALFKWRRRETEYRVGCIPLGGYVRMVGDMPDMITGGELEESEEHADAAPELHQMLRDKSYWFLEKGLFARSAIVFAGPLFNFLLAGILVSLSVLLYGKLDVDESARLGTVVKSSPAAVAGLTSNDLITAIDETPIGSWQELAKRIHNGNGKEILVAYERDGQRNSVEVTPRKKQIVAADGEKKDVFLIGIKPRTNRVRAGIGESFLAGVRWTAWVTSQTYVGLWGMLTGQVSAEDLAGPLFILDAAGEHAERGLEDLLYFMATLSVSLAVLNLLPIPVLDGGHLLFFFVEALIGPISVRKKEFAQGLGVIVLLGLMVFAIHNDISREPMSKDWSEENTSNDSRSR